jgi:cyclopropane-fatty-acyl-phospholipid synthase
LVQTPDLGRNNRDFQHSSAAKRRANAACLMPPVTLLPAGCFLVRFVRRRSNFFLPRALSGILEMTTATLRPPYEDVQAHYDISNDFFRLFLGETMLYTCGYFERDDMTLDEAGIAKNDLLLRKLEVQPGQRLLDVGCGWGYTAIQAVEKYGMKAVGISLAEEQIKYCRNRSKYLGDRVEYRVQGWEEFDEPVDRIVAICSTEHFREERYPAFFQKCFRLLPPNSRMCVQAIVYPEDETQKEKCLTWTEEDVMFAKFIQRKIFPGGQIRSASIICRHAREAGFEVTLVQSLQPHYDKTLTHWAGNLEANRETAIAITSQDTYDMYMHYLVGCRDRYRCGKIDLVQISLKKA